MNKTDVPSIKAEIADFSTRPAPVLVVGTTLLIAATALVASNVIALIVAS